ncbi:MAG: hypothetical protein K8R58_06980 [Bacteroidales bacterium]|nr:hypothetical protein [Bacteroidales bacterium]
MEQTILILILIIGIGIFLLMVYDIITLNKIKKLAKKSNSPIQDDKYYDLLYRYKFLMFFISFIALAVGFLGWNSYDGIKEKITEQFNKDISSINDTISEISSFSINFSKNLKEFEDNYEEIKENHNKSLKQISVLDNKISIIKENIKTFPKIYLIFDLILDDSKRNDDLSYTYYFKNRITMDSRRLPTFTIPPLVLIIPSFGSMSLIEVTKDYFKVGFVIGGGSPLIETNKFNAIIIEK